MKKIVTVTLVLLILFTSSGYVTYKINLSNNIGGNSKLINTSLFNLNQDSEKNIISSSNPQQIGPQANSSWPMFRHDINHTGRSTTNTSTNPGNWVWNFTTGGNILSSPAVDSNGTIYVGSDDKNLYAIYPNGTKKWNFTTKQGVWSSPGIDSNGTIYFGSGDDKLYSLYPNGTQKWAFLTKWDVDSSPVIGLDGTIYIGSYDGELYAIYPNGTKKWSFLTGDYVKSAPAIGSDGTIYMGSKDQNLYAINPDGTKKWNFITLGHVESSPAIGTDGTIYVGSRDNNLYAIYPNGTKKWNFITGGWVRSSPAIGTDGTIYVGSWDKNLYAINPNGTKKWSFITGDNVMSSPAIGSDGTIYVGSYDDNLYAINPNGTKKWSYNAEGWLYSSPAIGADGTIYIGSDNHKLYAIGERLSFSNVLIQPISGYTNTSFNFSLSFFDKYNEIPVYIKIEINGINYSMNEVNSSDTNYVDGKDYFFKTTLNIGLDHECRFFASPNGFNYQVTKLFDAPDVFNSPPKITTVDNITAFEDIYYEENYEYIDVDKENVGQLGTWNFTTNATWLSFNPTTAMLYGTPTNDDVGQCWVNISINDTMDMDFTNFTLSVIDDNDDPIINTSNIEIIYEDELYEVDYNATDIDSPNGSQIWTLETNSSLWLDIDPSSGKLSGIPTNDDVGTYWVNISVNDSEGGFDFTNFTLTVINVNDRPIINTTNVEITYEDELYEVDYNATDVDSIISKQVWTLGTNATSWLGIDSGIGVVNGTPTNDDVGDYWVNISVIDGDNGLAFTNFSLIVMNVNDPPVIITENIFIINTSELYEVDYNATDIDSPTSQFSWSVNTNATWLDIDSPSGILSGTPLKTDAGWYNVNVTVDDGDDGQDWHDFILEVIKKNEAPIITTTDVLSATANIPYQVQYEATDEDTPIEKLTWFLDTNASWLGIGPVTGILGGTPRETDIGWYWVNITVGDGEGGFDSHNFTLTVYITANQPPDILTEDDVNAVVNELYSVDYEAEDDHTPIDKLVWSLETNTSDWLDIDPVTGVLSGTPILDDVGSYWVKISVDDGEDGLDFTNFTLYVTTEPITDFKPELSNPSATPRIGSTETLFVFSVDYSHPEGDLPDSIQVVIDDIAYDLIYNASSESYEYRMKFYEGQYIYYFTTKLGEYTIQTEGASIMVKGPPKYQPENNDGDGEEDNTMLYAGIGIVVIIIIVVLILLFIFLKKKKEKEEEPPVEEVQPPPPEEASPEVHPEQVPIPEIPPSEQPPTPEVPPEQVPVPETPPEQPPVPEVTPEQPPTPEVTPQVVPQVEATPEPTPVPQVEEQPQPTPQVEQPQIEVQEPQPQPGPKIKTQSTIKENNP